MPAMSTRHVDEVTHLDKRRCPSCRSPWVVCAVREGNIGSFCCGDCTAHGGNHQWPRKDRTTQPEELA